MDSVPAGPLGEPVQVSLFPVKPDDGLGQVGLDGFPIPGEGPEPGHVFVQVVGGDGDVDLAVVVRAAQRALEVDDAEAANGVGHFFVLGFKAGTGPPSELGRVSVWLEPGVTLKFYPSRVRGREKLVPLSGMAVMFRVSCECGGHDDTQYRL